MNRATRQLVGPVLAATVVGWGAAAFHAPVIAQTASLTDQRCDRACLVGFTDQYMTALAATAKFTENGTRLPIGDGLWKIPTTLVARRDVFAEPRSGQLSLRRTGARSVR